MTSDESVAAARRARDEAAARARRDDESLRRVDSVIAELRAARSENHWADRVRSLFRGE